MSFAKYWLICLCLNMWNNKLLTIRCCFDPLLKFSNSGVSPGLRSTWDHSIGRHPHQLPFIIHVAGEWPPWISLEIGQMELNSVPLFTKQTLSYGYRNPHYRPSQVLMVIPIPIRRCLLCEKLNIWLNRAKVHWINASFVPFIAKQNRDSLGQSILCTCTIYR